MAEESPHAHPDSGTYVLVVVAAFGAFADALTPMPTEKWRAEVVGSRRAATMRRELGCYCGRCCAIVPCTRHFSISRTQRIGLINRQAKSWL